MQKTAYELRMRDWSSDVCSSYLCGRTHRRRPPLTPSPSAPEPRVQRQATGAVALDARVKPEHDGQREGKTKGRQKCRPLRSCEAQPAGRAAADCFRPKMPKRLLKSATCPSLSTRLFSPVQAGFVL